MKCWLRELRNLIPESRWAPITQDDTVRSELDALEAVGDYIRELEESKKAEQDIKRSERRVRMDAIERIQIQSGY